MYVCDSNSLFLMLFCRSKALRSLQNVSGIYGMVVPSAAVAFPGQIVGHFAGGETLRAVLPKPENNGRRESSIFREESSYEDERSPRKEVVTGYGVKLVYDVPQNKYNGTLDVRVCWHSLVYLAEVDFGRNNLSF
jgi:hypothetical protein